MSKIKAWLVQPDGEPQDIDVEMGDNVLRNVSMQFFEGNILDLTKVKFRGRLCSMVVDDEGMRKELPVNKVATEAYWANCRPGTTHPICGPAVIFGGVLP
ncbi:MAG TPA: DUF3846 domain-containing protein [Candidatus Saccharimonadia bacterium]|nr:DUF3846 domain-containing protein [Candidatus Saccharimonadia bacterium]